MTKPVDQYVRIPRRFLESPVWQVLNLYEWRALFRILLEHQRHSGYVKEGLPVTANDFELAGVQRKHISPSTRVLEALGIVECTRRSLRLTAGRWPNLWRPTMLPTTPRASDATHDYARFKTVGEARLAAEASRRHDALDKRGADRLDLLHRLRKVNATRSDRPASPTRPS